MYVRSMAMRSGACWATSTATPTSACSLASAAHALRSWTSTTAAPPSSTTSTPNLAAHRQRAWRRPRAAHRSPATRARERRACERGAVDTGEIWPEYAPSAYLPEGRNAPLVTNPASGYFKFSVGGAAYATGARSERELPRAPALTPSLRERVQPALPPYLP